MNNYIGKTRIELRNVHTGSMERIEHGNVYKGENIQKYLRTYGCFCNRMSDMSIPLWQDVVGGIMLFDSVIPTTSNIIPAGHKMVANGAYNILNTGEPAELGSWNEAESSVSSEGSTITLVYDWGTSQGNGDIACVALTSYTAGYIGIGNPSGTVKNVGIFGDASRRSPSYNTANRTFVSNNRRITWKSLTDNVLTLEIKSIWSRNAVIDGQTYDKTIELPSKTDTIRYSGLLQMSDTKLILIQSVGDVADGATLYIDEINTSTWQVISHYIVNNTGNTIGAGSTHSCAISDHEVLIRNITDPTQHYILDIDTGTFSLMSNTEYTGGAPQQACMRINDNLICLHGSWVGYPGGSYGCMLDRVNDSIYPCNIVTGSTSVTRPAVYDDTVGGILGNDGAIHSNPWYLATINNLEDVLTKDVSKTMKVIYTLQKAS